MLGWEFPPFIAGGLGTACAGLTKSMVAQGHEITFVFPQPIPEGHQSHVKLIGPRVLANRIAQLRAAEQNETVEVPTSSAITTHTTHSTTPHSTPDTARTQLVETQLNPYPSSYPGVDAGNVLRRVVESIEQRLCAFHEHLWPDDVGRL